MKSIYDARDAKKYSSMSDTACLTSDLYLSDVVEMFSKLYKDKKVCVVSLRSDDVLCEIDKGEAEYSGDLETKADTMKLSKIRWSTKDDSPEAVFVEERKDIDVIDISRR